MRFTHRFHALLKKLLMLWVRTDVLPKQPESNQWGETPVLYVLAARGLSELLVLEQVCEDNSLPHPLQGLNIEGLGHHSVYSVASRNPVSDWILQQNKHSLMLEELVASIQQNPQIDITIVPVSVFWGRPVAKQKHWLHVLFSDTWELAGRFRKLLTILINGRQTTLIFSPSQSLRQLCEQNAYSSDAVNISISDFLHRQREATFGPEIFNNTKMINEVIRSEAVDAEIRQMIEVDGLREERVKRKAIKYCREIFSDCTQTSQELMKRALNYFWNRFYSGIEVFDLDPVKRLALTHQLIYVPSHRSHIDYLLLSYVLFKEGLALPYIAAGSNLNMPVIGRILRGGGAFFIRRSFKDNPLYSSIMNEYMKKLVELGVPVEYFIEGGRSRTGRLLKPKLGMLSMTVDAWIRTQNKPIAFVPVYLGYEKLIEGRSYVGELYGQKKEKESLFGSIRSILTLKGQFGKVTTRFGNPIKLDEWLSRQDNDWQQKDFQDLKQQDWFRDSVSGLSTAIMEEINRATVINPVNLIATGMLATPRQSIDKEDLIHLCDFYRQMIKSIPQMESIRLQDRVDEASLERIQGQGLMDSHQHELGDIIYLKPEHAVLMSYYRNNSLHALIIPSLIACCFMNVRTIDSEKLASIVTYVYPFLNSELHLPWNKDELAQVIPDTIDFLVSQQVLTKNKHQLKRPDRSDVHYLLLSRLAHIAQPVLERYYMTFVVLWESGGDPISEDQLERRCHLVAQKISMIYGINSPDFFDRQLFGHFIDTLFELDFIERDDNDHLVFRESFNQINVDIRILLSIEVRSTILQLLNTAHHQYLAEN